ncbi:mannose/fructose/sorbose PTS transporter subunit IIB [Virgibacillus chiguensis]|uniref:PTS system, mannose-specific IIB component/PTS system, sorbose-specific IIB component n=1 Tax=Virgibacillus chiguensis TaxID=411959 RepID=A0A1M5TM73_9BACI|nr:mannose/fructose/sorbose PTS transporter subunit IIB [Virgibacillus chiguensis]SHH51766.1 PTS system, mannose-specific IIB component/PTS system, sorbose-specific IIB component [Virgibacillus chiguensis]
MIIGLVRIDDRLIHGQVATVWVKDANVSRIIVVNDEVAHDEVRKTLLKQVAPPSVKASVVSIDKLIRVYKNPKYENDRVMLLFTNPFDVERVIQKGIPLTSINIGGISYKEGKVKVNKSNFLNKEEATCFRRLAEKDIELDVRGVVSDPKEDMIKLLDKQNL